MNTDQRDDLLDMLQCFEMMYIPSTGSRLNEIVNCIGHKELIQKSKYILDCLAYTCKELIKTDDFQSCKIIEKCFDNLRPFAKKVAKLLQCSPKDAPQMAAFRYLKQY